MTRSLALLVLPGLLLATEARACRVLQPPATLIAQGGYDAVVTAEIDQAAYVAPSAAGTKPWRGTVAVRRVLHGKVAARHLAIGRSGAPTACDDGVPPPRHGERWVLYLTHAGNRLRVALAYPLETARAADPRLGSLLDQAGGG